MQWCRSGAAVVYCNDVILHWVRSNCIVAEFHIRLANSSTARGWVNAASHYIRWLSMLTSFSFAALSDSMSFLFTGSSLCKNRAAVASSGRQDRVEQ